MLMWFLPLFLVFLVIGLPVFFGLLAAPGLLLWLNGQERDIALLYRNVYNGMDSFPLMAIPFFIPYSTPYLLSTAQESRFSRVASPTRL